LPVWNLGEGQSNDKPQLRVGKVLRQKKVERNNGQGKRERLKKTQRGRERDPENKKNSEKPHRIGGKPNNWASDRWTQYQKG